MERGKGENHGRNDKSTIRSSSKDDNPNHQGQQRQRGRNQKNRRTTKEVDLLTN